MILFHFFPFCFLGTLCNVYRGLLPFGILNVSLWAMAVCAIMVDSLTEVVTLQYHHRHNPPRCNPHASLVGFRSSGDDAWRVIGVLVRFWSLMSSDICLHVSGCLNWTPLSGASNNSVILPKHHPVTILMIINMHESGGHLGYNYVLSWLWCCFWLINGLS